MPFFNTLQSNSFVGFKKKRSAAAAGGNKLFMWGGNPFGELGSNNTTSRSSPVQVGADTDWARVSPGSTTLAVKSNGTLWSWGANFTGALGQNDTVNRSSPVQVGALTNWSIPAQGSGASCFCIKTDGTLWAWGNNAYSSGKLGLGDEIDRSSPVQIGTSTGWTAISPGGSLGGAIDFSILAVDNGKLFSWGVNAYGQLGHSDTISKSSPVQIGALTNWKTPSSCRISLCVKTDGTLWSWGDNSVGQLGRGTVNPDRRSSPVQVGADTNWAIPTISAGNAICTRTNGTLWAWGAAYSGQLGLGDIVNRSSPTQIGALTNWLLPATTGSSSSTACVKTTGELWSWGANSDGQLGLGDVVERSSPVQIGALTTWSLPSLNSGRLGCLQS